MALAIILVVLLIGSVVFNFLSPWQATAVASNWGSIDTTIIITLAITGIFFIAISIFIIYALIKYRHREDRTEPGHQAAYEPDSKKLEWGLTLVTTVGICGLLAPGLVVYGDFIRVPDEASQVEVLGKQWMWSFRLPGKDGEFGAVGVKFVAPDNPFGIDPNDPKGQDDIVIASNKLHLPKDQPVKMLLRSLDVLHNFYVPQFRAKMDMVPGQISYFWFTPTVNGSYEILCAEYCGLAHYNMTGRVIVEEQGDYQQWLAEQLTYANASRSGGVNTLVEQGRQLAESNGCLACHSVDGSNSLGPGWQGLWGKTEVLSDGSEVVVDFEYFKTSIIDPAAQLVQGYAPAMAAYPFSDEQIEALVAYVKSLDGEAPADDASASDKAAQGGASNSATAGQQLAAAMGCVACHSEDGSRRVGPSFKGLLGSNETLTDGTEVLVDEAYIEESISNPSAKVVKGFAPVMQPYQLSEEQLNQLIAYLQSLADSG